MLRSAPNRSGRHSNHTSWLEWTNNVNWREWCDCGLTNWQWSQKFYNDCLRSDQEFRVNRSIQAVRDKLKWSKDEKFLWWFMSKQNNGRYTLKRVVPCRKLTKFNLNTDLWDRSTACKLFKLAKKRNKSCRKWTDNLLIHMDMLDMNLNFTPNLQHGDELSLPKNLKYQRCTWEVSTRESDSTLHHDMKLYKNASSELPCHAQQARPVTERISWTLH